MSVFDDIYAHGLWPGSESCSGKGAGEMARELLAPALLELMADLGNPSVLDVGCGDGYWMPDLPFYVGLEVSAVALGMHRDRHPTRDLRMDRGEPLPTRDLVISRCVMQHMTLMDGEAHLARIRASGAMWLLATTYRQGQNLDMSLEGIAGGGGYWPNLEQPPFSLGPPVRSLPDGQTDTRDLDCLLALWPL